MTLYSQLNPGMHCLNSDPYALIDKSMIEFEILMKAEVPKDSWLYETLLSLQGKTKVRCKLYLRKFFESM